MSSARAHAYAAVIASPLPGAQRLGIRTTATALDMIDILPADTPLQTAQTPLAQEAVEQLQRYFVHPGSGFTLPLAPVGTVYQQRVWRALCEITPGQPLSYGALARRLGSSPRAVAGACRANPVPLVIPCHRVVAASGLGGYMGATRGQAVQLKQWLLAHESGA